MKKDIAYTINPKKRILISAILLISNFICLMSQTMMVTALPVIQSDMNQPLTVVQWLTTGYMLLIGITTPLSSNIYEKFSNRHVFIGTIGLFIVGTCIGCVASNFWILLTARLIQAIATGILMSFQMTSMVIIFPSEKRGTIMGISSLVVSFGPAIGPTLAGFILSLFGWRYLFIFILPVMTLILLIGIFCFPNFTQPRKIKIDFLSVLLSFVGFGLALSSLSFIQNSFSISLIMFIIGILLIIIFVKRQLKLKDPMLKVTIFKNRSFRLMTLIAILGFMVLLGTEQMVSIFCQDVSHLTSMEAGMVLLPGAVLNAIGAAIVGRLYDQIGPKALVLCGTTLMIIGTIPFMFIQSTMPVWLITIMYAIRMIGNALVFSPVLSESFSGLNPQDISHATAMSNTLRQVFGSVSITLLIVISSIPHSFVFGMRISMWITMILTIALLGIFIIYIHSYKYKK